ncbi:hypothetical protein SAMN05444921_11329 [Streptomyces wuyuanensis]|uniref:Uncharacterized protein n=1 Tax=Streptomyces wuyuanensis TaxID=1196353 RepID=A0A1G9VWN2_9ACTN|nr:hypothetical protein SAMN05444921_11329 [Streptomyces wuyuanensis]
MTFLLALAYVALVTITTGIPLAHWADQPWRHR